MLNYLTCVGDKADPEARDAANELMARILVSGQWRCVLNVPGMLVFGKALGGPASQCYALADGSGIILGVLFDRRTNTAVREREIDFVRARKIKESRGRYLTQSFWGRYVAFLADESRNGVLVLQDPTACEPVYRTSIKKLHVYFAELTDLMSVTQVRVKPDWDYLARNAVCPVLYSEATGLRGVTELMGGQCDAIADSKIATHSVWSAATFARNRREDVDGCVADLRDTVRNCVAAWSSCYSNIMVLLSGGLDSSIIVSCLKSMRGSLSCLTYYGEGAGTDERKYARMAVQSAACRHIEVPLRQKPCLQEWANISPTPRPAMYTSALHEREAAKAAGEVGAEIVWTGNGGDGIFFELTDPRVVVDYVQNHWLGARFFQVVRMTADLSDMSVGSVAKLALLGWLNGSWKATNALEQSLPYRKLLSDETKLAARDHPERYMHPSLREAQDLSPAKFMHVGMVLQPMTVRPQIRNPHGLEFMHPLMSQEIYELCLAIPTYLLTQDGRTRSLARQAFAGSVPDVLLRRRTKGNPGHYVEGLVQQNAAYLRERLLDGQLIANGVLDRKKVEEALSGQPTDVDSAEFLMHASTEEWLERIPEANSSAKAAA